MKDLAILKPVFVQVALTFFIMFWMAKLRLQAVREGTVVRGPPGSRPSWPGKAGLISNAFHNQLEIPPMFYAVVAFALIAGQADGVMTVLAWAYAALRLVHAFIHTTYNNIVHRFTAYLASNSVLIAMWVLLGWRVLSA